MNSFIKINQNLRRILNIILTSQKDIKINLVNNLFKPQFNIFDFIKCKII